MRKTTDNVDSYEVKIPHAQRGFWEREYFDANTPKEAVSKALHLFNRECPNIATNPAVMCRIVLSALNERTRQVSEFRLTHKAGKGFTIQFA